MTALAVGGGLVLLWVSSGAFVTGASRIATRLRVSPITVGAVVIGFGTSLPEALVSALAAAEGSRQIALGNVVGSNLANVTLILGVLGLLAAPSIDPGTLRREIPVSTVSVVILAILLQKGFTRWDGVMLLVGIAAVMFGLTRGEPRRPLAGAGALQRVQTSFPKESIRVAAGLAGTLAGAQLLVTGAHGLAVAFGLAEGFVGLTIVAVGTSLPELASSIQAVRQGSAELALGNILGSNLFNSFAIGGLVAVINPGDADPDLAGTATIAMVGASLVVGFLLWTGRKLERWEAILLLATYVTVVVLTAG